MNSINAGRREFKVLDIAANMKLEHIAPHLNQLLEYRALAASTLMKTKHHEQCEFLIQAIDEINANIGSLLSL